MCCFSMGGLGKVESGGGIDWLVGGCGGLAYIAWIIPFIILYWGTYRIHNLFNDAVLTP